MPSHVDHEPGHPPLPGGIQEVGAEGVEAQGSCRGDREGPRDGVAVTEITRFLQILDGGIVPQIADHVAPAQIVDAHPRVQKIPGRRGRGGDRNFLIHIGGVIVRPDGGQHLGVGPVHGLGIRSGPAVCSTGHFLNLRISTEHGNAAACGGFGFRTFAGSSVTLGRDCD